LVSGIDDPYWYACALDGVVPALIRHGRTREALDWAATAPHPHRRTALTGSCAAALPAPERTAVHARAYGIATAITSPTSRVRALVLLAGVPDSDSSRVLAEAAGLAQEMDRQERLQADAVADVAAALAAAGEVGRALDLADGVVNASSAATALSAAARYAGDADLGRIVARARSIGARRERGRVLAAVARRNAVVGADAGALHENWREALRTMALGGREEFLEDAVGLLPVAEALGGPDVLISVADTTCRASRWWP
jgi:hypothetical protein